MQDTVRCFPRPVHNSRKATRRSWGNSARAGYSKEQGVGTFRNLPRSRADGRPWGRRWSDNANRNSTGGYRVALSRWHPPSHMSCNMRAHNDLKSLELSLQTQVSLIHRTEGIKAPLAVFCCLHVALWKHSVKEAAMWHYTGQRCACAT